MGCTGMAGREEGKGPSGRFVFICYAKSKAEGKEQELMEQRESERYFLT